MQITTRPKLFPPLALLRQAGAQDHPRRPALAGESGTLSPAEFRRIVADLIG